MTTYINQTDLINKLEKDLNDSELLVHELRQSDVNNSHDLIIEEQVKQLTIQRTLGYIYNQPIKRI